METKARPADPPQQEIGLFGWFALAGFVSMYALYFLDPVAEADVISPRVSLPIGVVAGIGAFLFWVSNDPTVMYING